MFELLGFLSTITNILLIHLMPLVFCCSVGHFKDIHKLKDCMGRCVHTFY